jgi:hypothetical protein
VRGQIGESARALKTALANRTLRRVLIAFVAFNVAEWATYIAVLVYAYTRGGTTEAAVVAVAQLAPAAVVAPFASALADRFRRDRVLVATYVVQAAAQAAAAAALLGGAPAIVVYAAAVLSTTTVVLTRPTHGALMPQLVKTPAELTAANAASGAIQNSAALMGPALAGAILGFAQPGAVFALTAAAMCVGALLVGRSGRDRGPDPSAAVRPRQAHPSARRAALDGIRALRGDRDSRLLVLFLACHSFVLGSLDVLFVATAISLLGMGSPGVGLLNAAVGLGGILGAGAALLLAGRPRLTAPMGAGTAAWSAPLAMVGLIPGQVVALVLLVVAGGGRSVADIAGRTLLQRAAAEEFLLRILGVLEGLQMAAIALGSIAAAGLVGLFGIRGGLMGIGVFLPVVVLASWRRLRRIEADRPAPVEAIRLLRSQPMFAALPPPEIEGLARQMIELRLPRGAEVIREGDAGDRFFLVADGRVEVTKGGVSLAMMGPGEGFGEIALLRDVPRTASVTAATELRLYGLDREAFLTAITGHPSNARAAAVLVDERLSR